MIRYLRIEDDISVLPKEMGVIRTNLAYDLLNFVGGGLATKKHPLWEAFLYARRLRYDTRYIWFDPQYP